MGSITIRLDRIASSLESKGYLKEAEEVDVISNTIERVLSDVKDGSPYNRVFRFKSGYPIYKISGKFFDPKRNSYRDIEELKYLKGRGYLPSEMQSIMLRSRPESRLGDLYFNTYLPLSEEDKELIDAEEIKGKLGDIYLEYEQKGGSYIIYRGYEVDLEV